MEFTCFLPGVMVVWRMLTRHVLYPELRFEGINDKLRYETIKIVFKWANKKGTIKEETFDKQKNDIQYFELPLQLIETM